MAKKVFLKDSNNVELMPITRGELILDSSGNCAFNSNEFLASESQPGLMSAEDKNNFDKSSVAATTSTTYWGDSLTVNIKGVEKTLTMPNKPTLADLTNNLTSLGNVNAGDVNQPVYFKNGVPIITNKLQADVTFYYSGNGAADTTWELFGGKTSNPTIQINKSPGSSRVQDWEIGDYSAHLLFGQGNTKAFIGMHYSHTVAVFGGGVSAKDSPNWYWKLKGTNTATYTLPTKTSTLASIDDIPTKTSQLIKDDVYMKSEVYNTSQVNELINTLNGVVGGIIDTWRPIHVQNSSGSNILTLGDGSTSGDITLKAGTNLTASVVGSTVTFDTTYNLFDLYTQSQKGVEAYGWGNHAGKYPTYDGTGATGTWGIDISGNAATATNADTLRGYTPDVIFRGSFFKNELISTTQSGWVTIAAVSEYVRSRMVFMIQSLGSSMFPRSTIISIDFSQNNQNHIIKISNSHYITGVRVCLINNTYYVDIYCKSQLSFMINLIVPMPYDSLANANTSATWYFGNLQLQYTPSDSIVYNTCMSVGTTTYSDSFAATSFIGNLDGTYVNKLTGYTKATASSNIDATDSLNTALGKLEYKAGTTYDWYKSITQDDTDTIINKWGEIVDFLDSVSEETDIINEFVTRKTDQVIIGKKNFNTHTNTSPLVISRIGEPTEAVSIGVNDSQAIFEYVNDEKSNAFVFKLINNDTEYSDGSDANTNTVTFTGSSSGSTIAATTLQGRLAYTYLTGSGTTKDQAIVSSGTVNGWTLKTLGSHAFDSTAYLPLSGGTMTGNITLSGDNPQLIRNVKLYTTTGWARSMYSLQVDGVTKFTIGGHGNYTTGATDNGINYVYMGCNTYNGLNLRISPTKLKWGDATVLHGSNYTSYTPILNSSSIHATNTSVIYAPTTAGTSGQYLMSNGSGAPVWTSLPALASPYAIKFKNTAGTEVSYNGSVAIDLTSGIEYAKLASQLSSTCIFGFENKKSSYCKIATISISSRYIGRYGLLKCYTTLTSIPNADSFEIFICAYQQDALGNPPIIKFKTTNTNNLYQVIGLLNYTSTSSTLDIYIYGYNRTYLSLNTSLISGDIVISPESYVDSLPSGTQITPTPMGNVEMLNGYLDSDFWKKTELTKLSDLTDDVVNGKYLPLTGGTLSGLLTINNTAGNGFDQKYISLTNNSVESARIGIAGSPSSGLGLYAKGTIYLRPNSSFTASTYGLVLSSTSLTYNGQNVLHAGNYTSYLGYIGTTAVQSSSVAQALTGITNATMSGTTTTKLLVISDTSYSKHIQFSRANYNYFYAPTSGSIAFCVNGYTHSAANCDLIISGRMVHPGASNQTDLGNTSYRWKNIYCTGGNFTSDVNSETKFKASNSNGAVSVFTSTNRGLYDETNYAWIIYLLKDASHVYVPKWANKGSASIPVYFNSSGEPVECTTYLGYIGTTAVQASSDLQSLTGIVNITMSGTLTMNANTGIQMKYNSNSSTGDVWVYPNGNPNYGIRYYEGTPDKMAISASGNNNTITGADLCINGNGDGTVTIRGNTILHTGNIYSNNLTTISKTLTVTQDWMDTGIKYTDLPNDGTYIIQIYTHNSTDDLWCTYWSGIMSWFQQETNDNDSDEIILHRAGHSYGHTIYLRTIMTARSDGRNLRLQIAADTNLSTASTYTFKFKRVI